MVPKREKNDKVLDYGFGYGKFYFLNSKGYSIFGAEISKCNFI